MIENLIFFFEIKLIIRPAYGELGSKAIILRSFRAFEHKLLLLQPSPIELASGI
ncbi:hypothetical protein C8N25_101244 [Algoriphagus antarcticus]|uniref:Uncharacterized protein n=1 Tax=Algoriphagus antarcticus TaxID=238540 RepID=A0A3E0E845_9BACT|nr:hypothetical protein C8N25_101244 [Algoriphagus antarcticus]